MEGSGKCIDFHWIKEFTIYASKFLPFNNSAINLRRDFLF